MTAATFKARFVLIGTMNPEEGRLRPQIMDRFGLRIVVKGLEDTVQRLEAYQLVQAYLKNPRQVTQQYSTETGIAREEIQTARDLLPSVKIPEDVTALGLDLIRQLKIDSLRAEVTLFESGKALAALDGRKLVSSEDIQKIAPMALRMRRSNFIEKYLSDQSVEEEEIRNSIQQAIKTS